MMDRRITPNNKSDNITHRPRYIPFRIVRRHVRNSVYLFFFIIVPIAGGYNNRLELHGPFIDRNEKGIFITLEVIISFQI